MPSPPGRPARFPPAGFPPAGFPPAGFPPAGDPPLRATTAALRDGTLVLCLAGEVTVARRTCLEHALRTAVAARPPLLVVDLLRLGFCDSTVLNALLGARLEARRAGVRLVLAGPPVQTLRLLRLTGTDRVFTVRASVQAATAPGHGDLFPGGPFPGGPAVSRAWPAPSSRRPVVGTGAVTAASAESTGTTRKARNPGVTKAVKSKRAPTTRRVLRKQRRNREKEGGRTS